jgi:hypothetical protein
MVVIGGAQDDQYSCLCDQRHVCAILHGRGCDAARLTPFKRLFNHVSGLKTNSTQKYTVGLSSRQVGNNRSRMLAHPQFHTAGTTFSMRLAMENNQDLMQRLRPD